MTPLFKYKRRLILDKSPWWTYLLYAVGEVILVVVGILIAVEIDNRIEQKKIEVAELESYADIISDLKQDSVKFAELQRLCSLQLKFYYHVFGEIKGKQQYDSTYYYDLLGVTRDVVPRTEQNHQSTIEKLTNKEVRQLLNEYFFRERIMLEAADEINSTIIQETRPYIFKNGIIDPDRSFHSDTYGFLPKDHQLVNHDILKRHYNDPEFINILSQMRISQGHLLSETKKIAIANSELIQEIEELMK